jgi:DNA-binding NtrC family response regulator
MLAKHFLNHYNVAFAKGFRTISNEALAAARAYAWPGNVRELRNVIERAVLLFDGDEIRPEHLSMGELAGKARNEVIRSLEEALGNRIADNGVDFDGMICNIEKDLVEKALQQTGYNQSEAARLLRIKRDKLRYKIKALDLASVAREGDGET